MSIDFSLSPELEALRKKTNQLLKDPEWTQVGFDPRRQTKFYIR